MINYVQFSFAFSFFLFFSEVENLTKKVGKYEEAVS